MMFLTILLAFIIGLSVGVGTTITIIHYKKIGNLRIDNSDTEPFIFLELHEGPCKLKSGKYVTLKVDATNYITHK